MLAEVRPLPSLKLEPEFDSTLAFQRGLPVRFLATHGRQSSTADPVIRTPRMPCDSNGLAIGRWKAHLTEFRDPFPNALFSCCCPCVALGQISARMGFFSYWPIFHLILGLKITHVTLVILLAFGMVSPGSRDAHTLVLLFGKDHFVSAFVTRTPDVFFLTLAVMGTFCSGLFLIWIRSQVREKLFINGSVMDDVCVACCCQSCTIAQVATQTSSYEKKSCRMTALSTLPGYVEQNNATSAELPVVLDQPQSVENVDTREAMR